MNRKIFLLTLCFLIVLVPMLFGATNNRATVDTKASAITYDPNAMVNPKPSSGPVHIRTGRAFGDILMTIDLTSIGMPGDGYDNAGLSWDGSYLYLVNMYDNKVYVIDPTTSPPSIITSWNAPSSLSWGCGHEQNLWITEYNSLSAYEYTYAGSATGNSFYCLMGGASWMGDASEWWPDGEIWILAVGGTDKAYKFAVPSGTPLDSIGDPTWTYISQRGLTYDPFNDKFFVGGWNSDMVWEINSDGTPTGRQFPFTNIASLAYDWQSSLYPTPVIWLATNTATNTLYMIDADNPQPAVSIVWDFETGLQGWTHTNGQAFPAGWDVEPSGTHTPPPDPGDSTMWIDSDAGGSSFWIQDTALSPAVVPPTNMQQLKYGYYNYGGSGSWINELTVGIRYFTSGAWNTVEFAVYPAGATSGPAWDSVDVTAYNTSDSVRVYFYFDDFDTWGYYAAFDNVGLYPPPNHDVGCNQITSPPEGGLIPAGDYDVIGRIKNFGDFPESFDATAEVYDTTAGWTQVFTNTVTFTDLPAGADSLVNFGTVTLDTSKVYYTQIYTLLSGDIKPENDTCSIYTSTIRPDFVWDFETGWQGWTHTNGMTFPAGWGVEPSGTHTPTPPDPGDSTMWVDSDAGGSGFWIHDSALSPTVIPNVSTVWVKYGYYNYGGSGSWINELHVGIRYFTGGAWSAVELTMYPSGVTSGPAWDSVDVSAYNTSDSMRVYFFFDDLNTWGYWAAFDNVMMNGLAPGVAEKPGKTMPLVFGLVKNAPNPVKSGYTAISYTTTKRGPVSLKVYDCAGRLVRTLVDRPNDYAGAQTVYWDMRDNNHQPVAAGVYFYRLTAENKTATNKMVVVK